MKINGVDPKTLPTEDFLVLPRGDQNLVFRAKAIPDMSAFNAQVSEPKPKMRMTADGSEADLTESGYLKDSLEYNKRRLAFLVVNSLEPSKIEWDTVKMDIPGTWALWEDDMKNAGLSQVECNLILRLVMEVNSLDESKMKKAREVFLLGLKLASAV